MTDLEKYLKTNRKHAYEMADKNTPKNADGHPVILKGDPWRDETEWDEMAIDKGSGKA